MRRISTYILTCLVAVIACQAGSMAQDARNLRGKEVVGYEIIGRDTVYYDEIVPAMVHPRKYMNRRDWRKYYQRLHNFSKAYPYALFVSAKIKETDSIFVARGYNKRQQSRYLDKLKDEILNDFEPLMRKLTLKQGLMMIRLIDRECGQTPYYILKNYLGGGTAGFWQGVAKLLKGNLKQPYDKFGQDKDLEELVQVWEKGEFDALYMFIFGKPRPEIPVPEKYRKLAERAQSSSR
ncbi:MAG: DUF4294 domain-containing protein [Bacteroidales bacterium]|nr:DUF4294 domain-containing protein [Candidatus Cacconaster merdequi]